MSGTLWITGAAGFTGHHLVNFLRACSDPPRIVGLDIADQPPPGVDDYHRVDLRDQDLANALPQHDQPEWVIHLAGALPPSDDSALWQINVGGTLNLLSALACKGLNKPRVVTVGSAAEYLSKSSGGLHETDACGGLSPYGRSKWAQSALALALGRELRLTVMVARTFNLIGPGLSSNLVAGWLCEQFSPRRRSAEIKIGNLESARDFVDIRDAVAAYWMIANHGAPEEIYNVCTAEPVTISQVLSLLCDITQTSPVIRSDPDRYRASDPSAVYGDYAKLENATGWRPRISLRDSLSAMLERSDR